MNKEIKEIIRLKNEIEKDIREQVLEEVLDLVVKETNIARTSKCGKTSRLTALYLKIKKL